jgi:glycosyltransferase involved in cell wall biosynthesis
MSKEYFDFIEIGESDFEYNQDTNKKGILVEPIGEYFDKLNHGDRTITIKASITHNKKETEGDMYYIPSEIIKDKNLPWWLRGCNRLYDFHPLHSEYKHLVQIEKVSLLNIDELYKKYNIGKVGYFKCICEGHDIVIMNGLYELLNTLDKTYWPVRIEFLSNANCSPTDVDNVIKNFKFLGYELNKSNNTTTMSLPLPKILVWSDSKWAFGRFHSTLSKYTKHLYDYKMFDWSNSSENILFSKTWKEYDILLGNTHITYKPLQYFNIKKRHEYLNKCIAVFHSELINHSYFGEKMENKEGPMFIGISNNVSKVIKDTYDIDAKVCLTGVDTECFYPSRDILSIKNIGFIGNLENNFKNLKDWENWCDIKRPGMFKSICELGNFNPVSIIGKHYSLNAELYDGIDMLIYTSTSESVGQGILEAGACNIPVISTNVGISKSLKNIKTFETVEEAVSIINELNDTNGVLDYAKTLGDEIRSNWNWFSLMENWIYAFDEKLSSNNEKKRKYRNKQKLNQRKFVLDTKKSGFNVGQSLFKF